MKDIINEKLNAFTTPKPKNQDDPCSNADKNKSQIHKE